MEDDYTKLKPLLDFLMATRGFDFSGYHLAMLERRIGERVSATACRDFDEYFSYVRNSDDEIDQLLDVITINVSRFFRDTLTFELIAERILPAIIREKVRDQDASLRIWSAGCAAGEEPYSLAILVNELLQKEELAIKLHLFATDIDRKSLKAAEEAVYTLDAVKNTKYGLLQKYFTEEGTGFRIIPEIKRLVTFAFYDMLDKKHRVPPESVFGNFDLVLCRNLLIYFNAEYQETIFAKLFQALAQDGCLVLGEAEAPTMAYRRSFYRAVEHSPIYRKR